MTDERRPGQPGDDDPELDPGTEAEVRRLLGEARETGPLPPEVAARLDETLASLREEPAADAPTTATRRDAGGAGRADVITLPRRRVRQALIGAAAAAAAVTIAVPVTLAVTGSDGPDASVTADGAAAESEEVGPESAQEPGADAQDEAAPEGLARSDDAEPPVGLLASPKAERGTAPDGAAGGAAEQAAPAGSELLLSRPDFEAQVTALVERGGLGPVPARACGAPAEGRRIAVRYEGDLGTLVLTPGEGVVRARLYVCGVPGITRGSSVPTG